jgi:hypothetical protein
MAIHHMDGKHSTNVHWARYDESKQELEIDFKNAKGEKTSTYRYPGFSILDWRKFQDAPSKGKHFAFEIRPKFKGEKK